MPKKITTTVKKKARIKRAKKHIVEGMAHVLITFNNTKITVSDMQGNVIAWTSAAIKFKGPRKSTPFAAQVAADDLAKDCRERFGLKQVHFKINGPGSGRESAIRAFEMAGVKVVTIADVTGIPHNGCRPKKQRRL